jgi:hypothetical protein
VEPLRAAERLEIAIYLVAVIPASEDVGMTITPTAVAAVATILPELAGLKELLDRLVTWPVNSLCREAPPTSATFPADLLRAFTSALRDVILRDAETLERAGAVTVERNRRGRRFVEGLHFPTDPVDSRARTGVAPPGLELPPPHPPEYRIGWAYDRRYVRLHDQVRGFRRRLVESPVLTLSDLRLCAPPPDGAEDTPAGDRHGETVEAGDPRPTHSPDFATVRWFGAKFVFTPLQQGVVAILWEDAVSGGGGGGASHILKMVKSRAGELREVFKQKGGRKHPAWGTMIIQPNKGVFTLSCHPVTGRPLGAA